MCVLFIAWRYHPHYPLVLAANRDEFHHRPTAVATAWPGSADIVGGRDLQEGGSWLALSRGGRFAAITNVREPSRRQSGAPSRGQLVTDFLRDDRDARSWLGELANVATQYNGFNLLIGDGQELMYFSNRYPGSPTLLPSGIHGISNGLLNDPWPKVEQGKARLARLLATDQPDCEAMLTMLRDTEPASDDQLPDTGVGLALERRLSPLFILDGQYGTRSSTVILVGSTGQGLLVERSFSPVGEPITTRQVSV